MSATRNRLLFGAAGLLTAFAIGFLALSANSAPERDFVRDTVTHTIELNPGNPDECWRWSFQSPVGGTIAARPQLCNGDQGEIIYDPDTQLIAKQTLRFKDSDRLRFQAKYAADGQQIIAGFALRDDGSKLWDASPDGNGMVTTYTYWWNGQLFSIEKRPVGSWQVERTYFHPDGNRWMHFVGLGNVNMQTARSANAPGMDQAQIYDERGNLAVEMLVSSDRKQATYTRYAPDGRKLSVLTRTSQYIDREEREGYWSMVTSGVVIYSPDDEKTVEQQYELVRGINVTRRVEIHADGSRLIHTLSASGYGQHLENIAADGKLLAAWDAPDRTPNMGMPMSYIVVPDAVQPQDKWEEAEHAHFQHTIVP